jgi:hypothetical protein
VWIWYRNHSNCQLSGRSQLIKYKETHHPWQMQWNHNPWKYVWLYFLAALKWLCVGCLPATYTHVTFFSTFFSHNE